LRDEIAEAAEHFRRDVFAQRGAGGPVIDAVRRVLAHASAKRSPFPFPLS